MDRVVSGGRMFIPIIAVVVPDDDPTRCAAANKRKALNHGGTKDTRISEPVMCVWKNR